MPRVKRGTKARRRRKKILKMAEGYLGGRHRLLRTAREAVDRALSYAYEHRRLKKRDFRGLWQIRISAALRQAQGTALKEKGLSYSRFIHQLNGKGIGLNRKMLSELAQTQPDDFAKLVEYTQG